MKNFVVFLLIGILITSCSPTMETEPSGEPSQLPVIGPAPELTNTVWLNSEAPLRLSDLRGQVVLLDMWTFG
jgi:hypothetical protein